MKTVSVLVVDDYQPFRRLIGSMLERLGMSVIGEAFDGLEAVQQAAELRPDLILLDVGLPKLNGIESAKRIRSVAPDTKILFVSQESSSDVVQEALSLGAMGYVIKSRAGTELLSAIETVLAGERFIGSGVEKREFVGHARYGDSEESSVPVKWSMKGVLIGACCCDPRCPCTLDAPTKGFCQAAYVWQITEGQFDNVPLDGLALAWLAESPGAILGGNVTALTLIDENANPAQRAALAEITGGESGGPWAIFARATVRPLGPQYVPFEVVSDSLESRVRIGSICEVHLSPIFNPRTKEPVEAPLDRREGFMSKRLTLGVAKLMRVNSEFDELNFDHSGQYAEFSHFEYAGEAED